MASKVNAKHQNLAGAFAGAPATPATTERGSRLQGLLNGPARTAAAPARPVQTGPTAPEAKPPAVEAPEDTFVDPTEDQPDASAGVVESRARDADGGAANRNVGRGGSASSVYLTADAYKQLTTTKRLKVKDYAQIVQDAFAQIAAEATDQKKSPDEILASLFEVSESADPWLMPSSTTRAKSPTPLTEARISFSTQQREWIEERMATIKVSKFSEFIARVLEHHLLQAKPKRGKKAALQPEG